MPIHLPPVSRRQFLAGSLAGAASLLAGRGLRADERATDHNRFALLADTHIAGDRTTESRGTNMCDNLQQVSQEVLRLGIRPAAVLVAGDCAYLSGERDDYAMLVQTLQPLREGGLPIHLTLGNHDHRQRFWGATGQATDVPGPVLDRHVAVAPSPRANWLLLDSLDETDKTPGTLGPEQLAWLVRSLDQLADNPALVMVHHNPDVRPKTSGLTDTKQLLEILMPRRHVKALIYGHTHNWSVQQQERFHLVNLPPTAYVFGPGRPNG